MEFSKKLAVYVNALFTAVLIAGIVLQCFGYSISVYVNTMLGVEIVVLGGYFGKAGVENVNKIKRNEGSEL
jgi:hypothetical protein